MQVLTHETLQQCAPSIFATQAHPSVSARYGFAPTIEVVEALRNEGWYPVRAQQTRAQDPENRVYAKHLVRFRQTTETLAVDDCVAELALTNSHDRTSAYCLDLGLLRLVCSNGLLVYDGNIGRIRVRHGRKIIPEVIEGSYALVEGLPRVTETVTRFQNTLLSPPERDVFAKSALVARYGEQWADTSPVRADQLLDARRPQDQGMDLWRTLNSVQENLLRGGLRGRSRNGRRTRTRAIKSVTEDVRINRALWQLASFLGDHKAGEHTL